MTAEPDTSVEPLNPNSDSLQEEGLSTQDNEWQEVNEVDSYLDFLSTFVSSKPAVHLLVIAFFMAMGVGSTVGVVPALMADRYARLHHGYTGEENCFSYPENKPDACVEGANDSQEAAAMTTLATNIFTLFCNSVIGSMSDTYGRRLVLVFSVILSTISPAILVLMQVMPDMDPLWFYSGNCIVGIVNYVSICFTILSDVIPKRYRTPGFGFFLGSFFLSFSLSPSMTMFLTHWQVSIFSFVVTTLGFLYALCFLPETLPNHVAVHNQLIRSGESTRTIILRPIRDLSILNQNMAIRLLAVGSFLSGMVYSTDTTLCLYYLENHLHINDSDLSKMFLLMGVVGIVIQAFLLKLLISLLGEKGLLVTSFVSGTFHNLFYGIAKTKTLIYVALSLSQLTKTNFPILSSLASAHASEYQQGSVQGALFALSAFANAIGPVCLQLVYNAAPGGTMFVVAAGLYLIGTLVVSWLPSKEPTASDDPTELQEPLLTYDSFDCH